ncbi:ribonuclease HII [endosymbiont of Acanthamoeba sp. UWC8]|uniref:ribonuclease HII n=1 Tax=endosymbiont of Acanthamoeba sp. UWC8 TaxID=86106 RepID=UPI0004D1EB80|nr:ribonuclease HII [endosymbiont of Acanthamoeba sp. UWC8]AIF81802.1 ribonuclease HII [endosymbiont of Acanthamoeba sp. UWC8]
MPDLRIEEQVGGIVVGVDEAGRGPLAGPVVAAAVIICNPALLGQVNDSKKLSKLKREKLFSLIKENAEYGIALASVEEIDELNILQATLLAMRRAIGLIKIKFDNILIDGNISPYKKHENIFPIVGGDAKSLSIAAASILAKVTRDGIMNGLHMSYPHYGWDKNSGYGTKLHIEAIKTSGITTHHRKTFLRNISR